MLLLSAFLPAVAFPQSAATPAAADAFRNESLVFERSETTIRMHSDGTGERAIHVRLRVQSEGAARQFGVLAFDYASATETPVITLVRVHKPDGRTIDTPGSDAMDMPAAVTREAPLYSDLKEKHLPVRSLSAGDTLEYEVHTAINEAEAPGQFWGAQHFTVPGTVIVMAEVFTLEVPKDKYVQVWSPNHQPTITEHDGLRSYRWSVAQLVPAPRSAGPGEDPAKAEPPKDPDEDADGRKLPSVAWTTFRNWAEVGDWYRSLALNRAQPDDALRARVDELTKDAKTPEDQIRALYSFVSTQIRYVGIDFGVGRYQPHRAAEVLGNEYGDCKDKDTLLEAMLRAKGFRPAPALIGAGVTPVPDVPTPAVFNHVITTVDLPGGRIWFDSTPEVAPYRLLSAPIRNELALVVPANAPASLERTPAAPPYPFINRFEAVGTLDSQGRLTSHITASYRTDDELVVRAMARSVAPAEWDKASQYVSSTTGFGGSTSNTSFANSGDFSLPIILTYDYTRQPYGDWESRRIVPAFPALEFNALQSSDRAPPTDIQLGAPRTLIAICRIRLPQGYRTDLPDPVHVKTDFATFDKTYGFDGKEIVIERNIVVLKDKLPKTEWKRYEAFTKEIGLEGEPWIQLIQPSKSASAQPAQAPPPGKALPQAAQTAQSSTSPQERQSEESSPGASPAPSVDASLQDLIQTAAEELKSGDSSGARTTLDKVKATRADQEGLWALYGWIAIGEGRWMEAKDDFGKELAAHPDSAASVAGLAQVDSQIGDFAAARQLLRSYLDRYPQNPQLSGYLATLQARAEDNDGALKTLQSAAASHPDDLAVRLKLSQALQRLGRNDEAAAAAKSVLAATEDSELENGAAYVLALAGRDLPAAEEASRKSIRMLEEKSASITTAEVNSNAFAQSHLLSASWATLGWIVFREGNPEEAEPLVLAGWRNSLLPENGDHLGQIYEKMGKKNEALSTYLLAKAALGSNNATPAVREEIAEHIARLNAAGVKRSSFNGIQELQALRTYRFARPGGLSGWGTFRLQIGYAGVVASQEISGEQKLARLSAAIAATKFPGLVPPGSKAHLLRSAVISCFSAPTCELVLVPNESLNTER
ncbi:MAG TPA: DUF3857 domain-containing protein [Acidobacteriaceae bacterium]|nr:DUF3857 domain-containing protein [Acidobacteriaceae bacterium]